MLAADKPRMSISGWYHAPQLDPDFAKASLNQLQASSAGIRMFTSSGCKMLCSKFLAHSLLAAGKRHLCLSYAPQNDNYPCGKQLALFTMPQAGADQHTSYVEFSPAGGEPTGELTASDKEALSNFINPVYLAPNAWKKVLAQFKVSAAAGLFEPVAHL